MTLIFIINNDIVHSSLTKLLFYISQAIYAHKVQTFSFFVIDLTQYVYNMFHSVKIRPLNP